MSNYGVQSLRQEWRAAVFHHAALRGYSGVLELSISNRNHKSMINVHDSHEKDTPLVLAARWQSDEIVRLLLNAGSDAMRRIGIKKMQCIGY